MDVCLGVVCSLAVELLMHCYRGPGACWLRWYCTMLSVKQVIGVLFPLQ